MSYTKPSISGYNASPPSDDASETSANTVRWSNHITKIGDPLKSYLDAVNNATESAWNDLASTATVADGAALVSQKHGGSTGTFTTNAVASTVQEKLDSWVDPVVDYDVPTDGTDARSALQAMFSAVGNGAVIKFPRVDITFDGAVSLVSTDNVTIIFEGTKFLVGDTGDNGSFTIGSASSGKMGFLFDQCDHLSILGSVELVGQGTVGATRLAGFVFAQCDWLKAPAEMFFDTFAAGRFVINCDYMSLGNAHGIRMDGLQTFETDPSTTNAGTVEVLIGCRYGRSGDVVSIDAEKPARYMSVGWGVSNESVVCGASICEYDGASLTSHPLAIRAAKDCRFGPVISKGGNTIGLWYGNYSGDTAGGYVLGDNYVETVQGDSGSTGASVDSLLYCSSTETTRPGTLHIGHLSGTSSGEHNIFVASGRVVIDYAQISGGSTRLIQVAPSVSGHDPELIIKHLEIGAYTGSATPVIVGKGAKLLCDRVDITDGPTNAVTIAIQYLASIGLGSYHNGIHIGDISYSQNGAANNYEIVLYDASTTAGPASITLRNVIESDASSTDFRIGTLDYTARQGVLFGSAAPSTSAHGTWRVGDIVWDITPVTAQPMGWVCSAAGNPGTWLSMASFA